RQGRFALADIDVDGPGVELGGTARVWTDPVRFEFALAGPLLDLDALLGVLPEEKAAPATREEELLTPSMRRSLQQASGSGTVALEELVSGALRATDVKLRATLRGGVLTLDEATAAFYGGEVRAD